MPVRVHDLAAGEGPLAGLVPALERAAADGATHAFILAVDMPRFSPAEFACLAAPLGPRPGGGRGRAAHAGRPRAAVLVRASRPGGGGVPARRGTRASAPSTRRSAALGPGGLVELDTTDPAAWPGGPARLRSINRPEDLRSVLAEGDAGT